MRQNEQEAQSVGSGEFGKQDADELAGIVKSRTDGQMSPGRLAEFTRVKSCKNGDGCVVIARR